MTTEEFLRDVCPNHTDTSKWNKSELLHILELHAEQLRKHAVISCVVVREDCPDDYWYSNQKGKQFNIKTCHYSDLRDVEGFSNKEPNECWKVADGEFAGNVIAKQHCL